MRSCHHDARWVIYAATRCQAAYEAIQSRKERLKRLERGRRDLLEHYATLVPEELERLPHEERHKVYKIVRLVVKLSPSGDLEMSGDLLPEPLRGCADRRVANVSTGDEEPI